MKNIHYIHGRCHLFIHMPHTYSIKMLLLLPYERQRKLFSFICRALLLLVSNRCEILFMLSIAINHFSQKCYIYMLHSMCAAYTHPRKKNNDNGLIL